MTTHVPPWIVAPAAILFLAVFAAFWTAVTALLGFLAGWPALAARYPDRDEPARLTLAGQYGRMGVGVDIRGALRLDACPSGLRVAIARVMGPFSKPFFVPWREVTAEPRKVLFGEMIRLGFGVPEAGNLLIYAKTWEKLSAGR